MQEFSSVTASSYDAESLAPMLTEKAGDGWTVVSIVSAGTNVVAYLSRDSDDARSPSTGAVDADAAIAEPAGEAAAVEGTDDAGSGSGVETPVAAESDPGLGAVAAGVGAGGAVGATGLAAAANAPDEVAVASDVTPPASSLPGESAGDDTMTRAGTSAGTTDDASTRDAAHAVDAVDEPEGWGAAPADSSGTDSAVAAHIGADDTSSAAGSAASDAGTGDAQGGGVGGIAAGAAGEVGAAGAGAGALTGQGDDLAATESDTAAARADAAETGAAETQAAAESSVPAGWYADPSGRFELRYWDGTAWTEHVSRAGQQYTDPPVA